MFLQHLPLFPDFCEQGPPLIAQVPLIDYSGSMSCLVVSGLSSYRTLPSSSPMKGTASYAANVGSLPLLSQEGIGPISYFPLFENLECFLISQ